MNVIMPGVSRCEIGIFFVIWAQDRSDFFVVGLGRSAGLNARPESFLVIARDLSHSTRNLYPADHDKAAEMRLVISCILTWAPIIESGVSRRAMFWRVRLATPRGVAAEVTARSPRGR